MANIALSTPTVVVNKIPYGIVPNSFEYEPGYGEVNVRTASIGGAAAISVHSENAENKIGMVKFQMYVTEEARGGIRLWKVATAQNLIEAVQLNGSPIVLQGASMTNNPTFAASSDGVVDVEFSGDPMPTI